MQTLTAPDGTTIAYEQTGSGPALILVMGALCDRLTTTTLAATLASDFTVYAYDRRGRGASGGADAGSVEREVDDLAALVERSGNPPFVFGHSSGGALALEAAARGVPMASLLVYEPPYTAEEGAGGSTDLLDRVRGCLDAGDRDGALDAFLGATGMPPEALAGMKHSPYWPRMRELAPTLVNDIALTGDGRVPAERFARITAPTVAAYGGASGGWAARSSAAVCAAVPGARQLVLEGQNHNLADDVLAPLLRDEFAA